MELIPGTHKATKFASEDFISNMPDNVVTNIVDRLPLQDAARTGILSRNWRFKWTMLTQLVFDWTFFNYLLETGRENSYGRIISRLLCQMKGSITKFVLYIDERCYKVSDDNDIARWILFLSTKGIKDLTFWKMHGPPLKLPVHLFSCLELKHLKLFHCCFDPPTSFRGFPNLLSLELGVVYSESTKFWECITRCPLLEILKEMKLGEIAKLESFEISSLPLFSHENKMITNSSSIFELLGSLPKLQQLDLDFVKCKFTEGVPKNRFPTTFPCLKVLKLSRIDLGTGIMLSCAFEVIRSFPNLQTLEITPGDWDIVLTPATCSPEVDYNEVDYNILGLLNLRSVVFTYLKASVNEVCLIKYLLACSPFLKRFVIRPEFSFLMADEKFMFARKLLKFHRASPVVDIDLS